MSPITTPKRNNHLSSAQEVFRCLQGGVGFSECELLRRLASRVISGCIVEIGSFRGKSAVALALGVRENVNGHRPHIYCIEPHLPFVGYYGGQFGPEDRGAFYRAMLMTGAYTEVSLVNLPSDQAALGWREPIGLLFIDGDHRYECVKRDFEYWEPHVIVGGLIAFDDATDPQCGPKHLIEKLLCSGRFENFESEGKIKVIRKRGNGDVTAATLANRQRILVACHELLFTGGLLRFERLGRILNSWGHEIAFVTLGRPSSQGFKSSLPVLSLGRASELQWDAVMVPGAGFPAETIEKFRVFQKADFGTRIQHILNDPSRRPQFKKVNEAFSPHIVIFNNPQWPPGSFTDFKGDRFHVIQGGVDTAAFRPAIYRPHALKEGRWIVGGLANKNPEPLIAALEYLPPSVQLRLFGQDIHSLSQRHPSLIASGRLQLLGILDGEDLYRFYREVDCIVMTETNAGWSNLVAEAMASGTPVVCTPHGTQPFARHLETAIVVDRVNSQNIAASIRQLADDPHLCKNIAESARKVISGYSWDSYARRLLRLIRHDGYCHYTYEPHSGLHGKWPAEERLSGLQPLLDRASGMSIIDIGCAEGIVAREFLKRGALKLHGFELDPRRVAVANSLCSDWPNASFRCADLSKWDEFHKANEDLVDCAYDIVLYLGIQHHLPLPDRHTTLKKILDLARRYFAIRTTPEVFSDDGIDKLLKTKGFRELEQPSMGTQNHNLGTLRIFERSQTLATLHPIQRHLVSYPKSGRTWIRYILNQLGVDKLITFHHDGFEFNDGSCPPLDYDLERRIKKYAEVDRIVYLERDPRDVMVSLYHQITGRFKDYFNYDGDISDFIRDPYFGARNLHQFRKMWDYLVSHFGFLKISYEECHHDLRSVIIKLLDYYNIDTDATNISKAIHEADFDKMRQTEQSLAFPHPWLRPRNNAFKVRKGKIGSFREELSDQDIRYLTQTFGL